MYSTLHRPVLVLQTHELHAALCCQRTNTVILGDSMRWNVSFDEQSYDVSQTLQ
jgi:hypothetical protein